LRVPDDLSVVGFDNIEEATYFNGGLTTVDQALNEMAQIAVKVLLDLIQGKPVEDKLWRVSTRLIVRNTCRAIEPDRVEIR
jgi:DNA-binding LacI/PurR family transcriptional regulator